MARLSTSEKQAVWRVLQGVHVLESNLSVLRMIWKRLRGRRRGLPADKAKRKAIYRHALRCHADNHEFYRQVMTGDLNNQRRSKR